jgi:hypothetical protein
MITLCYAAKGGSGTSVIAAAHALERAAPTLLVDLEGDAPAVFGNVDADRPGVVDWLASDAPGEHLDDLVLDISPTCRLLPAWANVRPTGSTATASPDRWAELASWLARWAHDSGGEVVIDAGTSTLGVELAESCTHRWLVTRSCYLSLRRAALLAVRPTGVVLVAEPGRSLRRRDIETAAGAPVIATIDWDPLVARTIDAGLLLSRRLPPRFRRALTRAAA